MCRRYVPGSERHRRVKGRCIRCSETKNECGYRATLTRQESLFCSRKGNAELPGPSQLMKSLALVFVLVTSLLGQTVGTKDVPVTIVAGKSWLSHLHRKFDETSMGKTGRLGPPAPMTGEETTRWQLELSPGFATQTVTLHGSDLYRLNCWGCHGEAGVGAPPEINSVINPVRASSVSAIMERMKKVGMDISRADAAELAKQSKTALLQRLHNGGQDMPPFSHLSEAEIRSLVAYLKQLAGVSGAEREQVAVKESSVRVGEHIVKSTCHICHSAAGLNPNPEQLLEGAIPPLSTLTTRTSRLEFVRKVMSGAPCTMGTPPRPWRGRMPVFYYLSEDEAADVYLYLTLYPPYPWAILDPVITVSQQDQTAGQSVPVVVDTEPTKVLQPSKGTDLKIVLLPFGAELFVTLLLAGGVGFTVRELRRLSAESEDRNALLVGGGNVAMDVTSSAAREGLRQHAPGGEELAPSDNVAAVESTDDQKAVSYSRFQHNGYFTNGYDLRYYESTWLARLLENQDWIE
jgi:mono/diheme cytochrome c family protein